MLKRLFSHDETDTLNIISNTIYPYKSNAINIVIREIQTLRSSKKQAFQFLVEEIHPSKE